LLQEFEDVDATKDAISEKDMEEIRGLAQKIRDVIHDDMQGARNDAYLEEMFEPLYRLDKFQFFAQVMSRFPKVNPEAYQAWSSAMSPQQRQVVQQLINLGMSRAAKKDESKER